MNRKINIVCILLLLFFFPAFIQAQAEYIQYDHTVYNFLERLEAQHIISDYNSFEKPITRKQAAQYLQEVINKSDELNNIDKSILEDLKIEFEYELFGTLRNSSIIFNNKVSDLFTQKEKYIYFSAEPGKASLFINFIGSVQNIPYYDYSDKVSYNASYVKYGGILRGTFFNKFGYYLLATNGKVIGDRIAALTLNEIKFNYKYNTDPLLHTGNEYIDLTEGHITADFDLLRFKFGRDTKTIGYGPSKFILGENIPKFDYLSFDINYGILNFSYLHGKLLGNLSAVQDSVQGAIRSVSEKYLAYHRLGFNISNHIEFGLGEMVIYGNRSVDFSYLNPFNFYKSIEHSNQDRDNSLLFLDVQNNSLKGLKLTGALLIDDIDFSKLGTSWYGNELLYNFSLYSSNIYNIVPVDFYLQYLKAEPYVYTHRIHNNSYTTFGNNLAAPVMPNSDLFLIRINYYPHYRFKLQLEYSFMRHGANPLNDDGTIKRNVGGDVLVGHREFDSLEAAFLDGDHEYYRNIIFSAVFEPFNNYYLKGQLLYQNNSLQELNQNFLAAYIVLDLRL